MKNTLSIILLSLAILILPQSGYSAELLTNGSFESGFTGWTATSTQASNWCSGWITTASNNCLATVTPQDGANVAMHGFDGTGGEFRLYQDVTIPAGMSARLTFMFKAIWNISSGAPRSFHAQVRDTSDNVLQNLYTFQSSNHGGGVQTSGWITEVHEISGYAGQTVRIFFLQVVPERFRGPGQFEIDGITLESFAPTAANVNVQGRVLDFSGRGIGRAFVSITDSTGHRRTSMTNPFGYYVFTGIEAGQSYIVEVNHKRYLFPESPRILEVFEKLGDVIFTASP